MLLQESDETRASVVSALARDLPRALDSVALAAASTAYSKARGVASSRLLEPEGGRGDHLRARTWRIPTAAQPERLGN